tara:strand:- start:5093 stop:5515 length:423 start_codon:yes stop_codon:yes gene_type:complete
MTKKCSKKAPPDERHHSASDDAATATPANLYDYAVCPLCGMNRIMTTHDKYDRYGQLVRKGGLVKWDNFDPESTDFIQIRQQHKGEKGWVCKGFTKVPGAGKTIAEAYSMEHYQPVVKSMMQQIYRIVDELKGLGIKRKK